MGLAIGGSKVVVKCSWDPEWSSVSSSCAGGHMRVNVVCEGHCGVCSGQQEDRSTSSASIRHG